MNRVLLIVGAAFFLLLAGVRGVANINYDRNIGGLIKQTADASTVELAAERLEMAIDGIDRAGYCPSYEDKNYPCHTSILFTTPDENVGFWRRNLKKALESLKNMSPEDLEDESKTGILLVKVRETLLDTGQKGDYVTSPTGISIYGFNGLFAFLWIFCTIIIGWGIGLTIRKDEW